jgi:hypothetical protein
MKTTFATLVCLVAAVGIADAQGSVEVDDLRAPTSPAFALLDVTPASVNRPENPKAFTLNVINALAQSNGLPQNYALEVAPYWLASHPDLTFKRLEGLRHDLHRALPSDTAEQSGRLPRQLAPICRRQPARTPDARSRDDR